MSFRKSTPRGQMSKGTNSQPGQLFIIPFLLFIYFVTLIYVHVITKTP